MQIKDIQTTLKPANKKENRENNSITVTLQHLKVRIENHFIYIICPVCVFFLSCGVRYQLAKFMQLSASYCTDKQNIFLYPPQIKIIGVYKNHLVNTYTCLSMCIKVQLITGLL